MSAPAGSARAAAASFGLPLEGARMLLRERRLWSLALVPALISLLALGGAIGGVVSQFGAIQEFVQGFLPTLEVGDWYTWLWIGPGKFLLWLLGKLLSLGFAVTCVVVALLLASLIASPFHDTLSRRVEQIETGMVSEPGDQGFRATLREGGRAAREELRRVVFFLVVWLLLLLVGIFVPGGQLVAPPVLTLFTVLFLPLDYASYTLDRRQLSFRDKRRWLVRHVGAALGYGAAAFLLCAVPVVNLVAMPILVVAGTLLVLRNPPAEGRAPGVPVGA